MTLDDLKLRIPREVVDKEILLTPQTSNLDAMFESITMPHWSQFVTTNDIDCIYQTVTSRRLAGNFDKRKKILDDVMAARGFKFLAGGTNRATYRHLEVPTIVAKVPIDKVGLHDNQCEYLNQKKLWPFCAKMIQVTPYGAVGFAERLEPILNRNQFNAFAPMIYWTIIQVVGKFVMEDIGTNYYKNWGIRKGFGACLLDYVYLFDLDGSKLICKQPLSNGQVCLGEIDYDPGFNQLYCKKCGRMYNASELQMAIDDSVVLCDNKTIGGKKPMLVTLKKGDKVLSSSLNSDSIVRPEFRSSAPKKISPEFPRVTISKGKTILASNVITIDSDAVAIKIDGNDEVANSVLKVSTEETPEVFCPVPTPAVDDAKETEVLKREAVDEDIAAKIYEAHPIPEEPAVIAEAPVAHIDNERTIDVKDIVAEISDPVPVTKLKADDFPPNQWNVQPSLSSRPRRRIITDNNTSSEVVQRRPENPYNK